MRCIAIDYIATIKVHKRLTKGVESISLYNLIGNSIKVEAAVAIVSDDDVNQNRPIEGPSSQHFPSADNATFNYRSHSHDL